MKLIFSIVNILLTIITSGCFMITLYYFVYQKVNPDSFFYFPLALTDLILGWILEILIIVHIFFIFKKKCITIIFTLSIYLFSILIILLSLYNNRTTYVGICEDFIIKVILCSCIFLYYVWNYKKNNYYTPPSSS